MISVAMNHPLITAIKRRLPKLVSVEASAEVMVSVLLGEQLLNAVIGIAGGLWLDRAALLLHLLIIGQLLLDGIGLGALFYVSGLKLPHTRIFVLCLVGLCLAAVFKNLHVSPTSAASDLLRLVIPLGWIALTPVDDFWPAFIDRVRHRRYLVIALLALQIVGLVAGRLHGWGGAYLSGNPLIVFLVIPIVIDSTDLIAQTAAILLAVPLLIFSLKRTAWLSSGLVIVLVMAGSLRRFSGRAKRGLLIAGLVAIGIAVASVYGVAGGSEVAKRATSLTEIASNANSDYSFAQRVEEISSEITRVQRNPIPSLLFGLPSDEVKLPNGQVTHAIHVTPLFLLFGGGLLWIIAFLLAGRSPTGRMSSAQWLITVIAVGSLLDSLGGNNSLAPNFGIALAIIQMQIRRLFRGAL
jgi:hypothetical protein